MLNKINKAFGILTVVLGLFFLLVGEKFWMLFPLLFLEVLQIILTISSDIEEGSDIYQAIGMASIYIFGMFLLGTSLYFVLGVTSKISPNFEKSIEELIVGVTTIVITLFSCLNIYNILAEREPEVIEK
jgi:ABC-type nitrate/sulfonate/bicarbonate transport system permease component